MRIAHVYGSLNKMHGATKWLMSFSSKLQDEGHLSTIYCVTFSVPVPHWFTAELNPTFKNLVISEKLTRIRKLIFTLFQLVGIALMPIRFKKPDCIVYHSELSVVALFLGRIFYPKSKHIYYCYQPPRELYDRLENTKEHYGMLYFFLAPFFGIYRILDRWLVAKADRLLVWSPEVEKYARTIYGNAKFSHIPPGVDYNSIEHAPDIANRVLQLRAKLELGNVKVLLSICSLTLNKNLNRFIELVAETNSRGQATHGIIIGAGPEQESRTKKASDLKISDKVHLVGTVTEEELPVYIHMADILLYLEINGAWTMASVEAGAAKKPIIVGPGGSMETLVKDGVTGLIVDDVHDIHRLAAPLFDLITDVNKTKTMGLENYEYSKQFSIEFGIQKFISLCTENGGNRL